MAQSRLGLALILLGTSQSVIAILISLDIFEPVSIVFTLFGFIGVIVVWIGGGVRQDLIILADEFDNHDGFKFFVYIWLFFAVLAFLFLIVDAILF